MVFAFLEVLHHALHLGLCAIRSYMAETVMNKASWDFPLILVTHNPL